MIVVNICPACLEPLNGWHCGNEVCKSCDKPSPFEELVVVSKEDDEIACPHCGFVECFSFWEVQNIDLFCTTQGTWSLTEASDLYDKRREERIK